jgi:hypothetical protein
MEVIMPDDTVSLAGMRRSRSLLKSCRSVIAGGQSRLVHAVSDRGQVEQTMRVIAVIGLIASLSSAAFGQTMEPHHQPSQAEVERGESDRFALGDPVRAAGSAKVENGQVQERFLAACMARIYLDEPLGSEEQHRRFCTCRIDALKAAITPGELEAVALNIEERNAAMAYVHLLPVNAYRSNQAAIDACMNELSR